MYTLEAISEEQIQQIYKTLILYSLENYQQLPENYKEVLNKKYENALNLKNTLEITDGFDFDKFSYLQEQKQKIDNMKKNNQPVIDEISKQIVIILKQEMPKNLTQQEKCEYIFDYITQTMEYSNDWCLYHDNIPPVNGFDFNFYKGIPLSTTYEGLLVTRQGICEEIANVMIFLGMQLGVEIKRETCYHNNNLHAINFIIVNNQKSYLDATSVIRNLKTKEEACLVSSEKLNSKHDYKFRTNDTSMTLEKHEPKYNMEAIIYKINNILPTIHYIEETELEK